ncbi:MAG: nitronate monooxygenase [Desulfotalea sp.]
MKLPPLKIGKYTIPFPLLQGGMSIRVSTSELAAPVAECGGMGIIGGTGIPKEELAEDIIKAKKETNGVVGVNVMFAMKDFYSQVMSSIESKIDMIVTGAGFSRDIFKIGKEHDTPIVMIVSSPKFAKLAERLGASAIIAEAKEAGGHLGTDKPLREMFPAIRDAVKNIPLIAAGGITNGYEMAEMMDKYGADGVQVASRFVLSKECPVADSFKQSFLDAKKEDIVLTSSPVGLPGRAINNAFVKAINAGKDFASKKCPHVCLKSCDHHYCINERLMNAKKGLLDEALMFAGENTYKMNEILSVSDIFASFKEQAESVYKEQTGFSPA